MNPQTFTAPPARDNPAPAGDPGPTTLAERWHALGAAIDQALNDLRAPGGWLARLLAARQQAVDLAAERPDAALYHLMGTVDRGHRRDDGPRALLRLLVCRQAAALRDWPAPLRCGLELAALTLHRATPTAQRQRDSGAADALWVQIVALNDTAGLDDWPLDRLPPAAQASRLLRRVDGLVELLGSGAVPLPVSPALAVRQACLGADGVPDEIGAALLGALGVYPPGSFVRLASDETAVVVGRGVRANLPQVVVLVDADGSPARALLRRDTGQAAYAVRGPVSGQAVRVVAPHDLLMAAG